MRHAANMTAVRLMTIAVLVLGLGFGVWWAVRSNGTTTPAAVSTPHQVTGAAAISEQGLATLSRTLQRPIYWAGPNQGTTFELTQSSTGSVYLRYLPRGAHVGTPTPYLTVGTYPMAAAYADTVALAHQRGSVAIPLGHGAVAFYRSALPTNVYLARAGSPFQVEVFDPSATRARTLVSSGAIEAVVSVGGTPTHPAGSAASAASSTQLTALQAKLGHPIYWLGGQSGSTYELTQTVGGRVYIRYLPHGVAVGASTPYLTVATYPLAGAYATTRSAASRPGVVKVPVAGGVAFYASARPTSVYLAFPGVNEQVEVFDPSAAVAHSLVSAHRVRPVG